MSRSVLGWLRRCLAVIVIVVPAFGGCSGAEFTGSGSGPGQSDGGQSDGGQPDGGPSPGGEADGGAMTGDCTSTKHCGDGADEVECGAARDGCGNTLHCGGCASGKTCDEGRCVAQDYCGDDFCGKDETCESCPDDCACGARACIDGACCKPDCAGKTCGEDGCGGLCPAGCNSGSVCQDGACHDAPSCGNGTCEAARDENCSSCPLDCSCAGSCLDAACCQPQCDGKACGSDGCGGSCGKCGNFSSCAAGVCVPDVVCGHNDCQSGENCANCANDCGCAGGQTCTDAGACCAPNCAGKECGSDGCGGQCAPGCASGKTCNGAGQCVAATGCGNGACQGSESCHNCAGDCACAMDQVCTVVGMAASYSCCTKQCTGKTCGPDGCNGTCGPGCSGDQVCSDGKCFAPVTSIKVQSYADILPPSTADIRPNLQIVNTGSATVAISAVKLRYWFTYEATSGKAPKAECDFAAIGAASVNRAFVKVQPARPGADYYLELSFTTAQTMAPGSNSGKIQMRAYDPSFTALDQTDDYSFDPTSTTFVDSKKVTAYIGGALVWGEEP